MVKPIMLIMLILFVAPLIPAQELEEYEVGEGEDPIIAEKQAEIQRFIELSDRIDAMRAENVANLETAAAFLLQQMANNLSTVLIALVLINLATQGLWWAIFLKLKSKKLL